MRLKITICDLETRLRVLGAIFYLRKSAFWAHTYGDMTGKARLQLPKEELAEFCQKWGIRELALFGSVLRDDFRPDSDVDVLIDFKPGRTPGLFDVARMAAELEKIFGREVDLLTRPAVEQSRNYIRRKAILSSLQVVYVS